MVMIQLLCQNHHFLLLSVLLFCFFPSTSNPLCFDAEVLMKNPGLGSSIPDLEAEGVHGWAPGLHIKSLNQLQHTQCESTVSTSETSTATLKGKGILSKGGGKQHWKVVVHYSLLSLRQSAFPLSVAIFVLWYFCKHLICPMKDKEYQPCCRQQW